MTNNQTHNDLYQNTHIVSDTGYSSMKITNGNLHQELGKAVNQSSTGNVETSQLLLFYENQIKTSQNQFPMQQEPRLSNSKRSAVSKERGEKRVHKRKINDNGSSNHVNEGNNLCDTSISIKILNNHIFGVA